MKKISRWASRISDAIAAALLAAIFLIFLLQIASRYLPKIVTYFELNHIAPLAAIQPLGWTLELIGILWVWVIFFSCAFVVRERDHVKFDILYLVVSSKTRRVFALITALAIVVGMVYAFLPTWDYIDFMRMRRTATVRNPFTGTKIPLRTIFFIYMVFMAVVGARYAWLFVTVWRHGPPKTELELVVEAAEEKP